MALKDNLIANESIVFESQEALVLAAPRFAHPDPAAARGVLRRMALARQPERASPARSGNLLDLIRNVLLIVAVVWIIYNIIVWRTAEFADHQLAGDPRGGVHLEAPVGDAPRERDRRQDPRCRRWVVRSASATSRSSRSRAPPGPTSSRPSRTDRIPRQDHGQEDGRCRPGRRRGRRAAPAAAAPAAPAAAVHRPSGDPGRERDAHAARRAAGQRGDHGRGLRGEEGGDPRADVAGSARPSGRRRRPRRARSRRRRRRRRTRPRPGPCCPRRPGRAA